ncbi:hypothetical protein RRG08_061881 [Elysia crispata]|uniref:C-type lectin domain-containing protein n=1 Tax=Elysia crispata TaxID=231223 RepID=A0AAE0XN42_9GAST|nr:hypothetical protein RRG08_061881 [Elysia crispata]
MARLSNHFVAFTLITVTGVFSQTPCRYGWTYFQGSCYGFGHERMTWPEAEQMCVLYEGTLAEIESKAENDFVKNYLRNNTILINIYGAWIGGTDIFTEGTWEWAGTKDLIKEFTDWGPNEPNSIGNDGLEDCLAMWKYYDWKWNDEDCHTKQMHFVCETGSNSPDNIIGR